MAWLKNYCNKLPIISFCILVSLTAKTEEEIKFKKDKIEISGHTIEVELAESPEQHSRGLMFRRSLGANQGMLFIFPDEDVRVFWMKNTFIDLSIGYFDKDKKLIDMQEMLASESVMDSRPTTYPSKGAAKYALEMAKGWFTKNKIKIGQRFRFVAVKKP